MLLGMFLKIIFKVFIFELRHSAPRSASRPSPPCSFLIRGTVCHLSKGSLGMMLPSHWATISSLRVFSSSSISLSRRSRLSSPIKFAMAKDSPASSTSIQELFILAGYSPVVARTLDALQLLKCVNDKWQ